MTLPWFPMWRERLLASKKWKALGHDSAAKAAYFSLMLAANNDPGSPHCGLVYEFVRDGKPVPFGSVRALARHVDLDHRTLPRAIDRLVDVGLVRTRHNVLELTNFGRNLGAKHARSHDDTPDLGNLDQARAGLPNAGQDCPASLGKVVGKVAYKPAQQFAPHACARELEREIDIEPPTPFEPAGVCQTPEPVQPVGGFSDREEREPAARQPPHRTSPPSPTVGFRAQIIATVDAAWATRCAAAGRGVDPDKAFRHRVWGRLLAEAREEPALAIEAMDELRGLKDGFVESRGYDLKALDNRIAKCVTAALETRRVRKRRQEEARVNAELAAKYGAPAKAAARDIVAETRALTSGVSESDANAARNDQLALLQKQIAAEGGVK